MKSVVATFRWLICLLIVAGTPLLDASAASTGEMRAALLGLVDNQHLEQHWPAILRNSRIGAVDKVRQGATDAIESSPALTQEQRARAKQIIDEMAPQIAVEIDAMHHKLDIRALTFDMVEAVYPKYFSVAEINSLAAFYGSPAFQKTASISEKVAEESKRTGQSPSLVWVRYAGRLTAQETNYVLQFQNSPLGRKQQALGPKVSQESMEYLNARLANTLNSIIAPFQEQLMRKLRDDLAK